MSFYRIYRPQVISELDTPEVTQKLLSFLTKDLAHLPHAYLFSGPKGTGKTTAARILAKIFNCKKSTKKGPCGKCDQCQSIANGTNLDVLEIDAASNRGIDEIRELRDRINLAPAGAKYKIYIIDEVHMLTTEAFNALLKTLEEPPRHAIFILATTDPQKVPATIKSRCVPLIFARASTAELLHTLKRVSREEKIPIEAEALSLIAESADGSFRDAVKLLELVSFHKGKIKANVVQNYLALATTGSTTDFINLVFSHKTGELLKFVDRLIKDGLDLRSFLTQVLSELEKRYVGIATGKVTGNLSETREAIAKLSAAWVEMKSSPIPQLPLELAVVEFCQSQATTLAEPATQTGAKAEVSADGLLTLEKLTEHWTDFIESLKPYNHSVAGVLRSARPKTITRGIVTIEAFYKFHEEKLSEIKTREMLSEVLRKLFGEKVKVEIVLGKK